MFRHWRLGLASVCALALAMNAAVTKADDDDCERRCERKPTGDLEDLSASLDWRDGEWCLRVKYQLELEDARRCDAFDLVLTPTECGEALADADGRTIVLAVSLPVSSRHCDDDDEIEICDRVAMRIPEKMIRDPHRVRVCAELVDRTRDRLLDKDSACVSVRGVPCEVVVTTERCETRLSECPPPPPAVVYVERPVCRPPVIIERPCPPPVFVRGYYSSDCWPSYRYRRYYRYGADVDWGRGWVHVGVGRWRDCD